MADVEATARVGTKVYLVRVKLGPREGAWAGHDGPVKEMAKARIFPTLADADRNLGDHGEVIHAELSFDLADL